MGSESFRGFGNTTINITKVVNSSGVCAYTDPELFGGVKVPIGGIAGDQQASLFGQLCFKPGMAKTLMGQAVFTYEYW